MDNRQLAGLNRQQGEDNNNEADVRRELAEQARAGARRRFIKGAAAASPILLSLVSRPVMGTTRYCTASGFMSGNLSGPPNFEGCGGRSPGYWKTHSPWPYPYKSGEKKNGTFVGGTEFHAVFAMGKYNYGAKSMLEVLWTAPGSFAFHTIAALLNAASGINGYALTPSQVIQIWNSIMASGAFQTSNGLLMYEADAKAFFENTYS